MTTLEHRMKVKDLIRQLSLLPPDLPVVIDVAENPIDENGFADVVGAYVCDAERPGFEQNGCVESVKLATWSNDNPPWSSWPTFGTRSVRRVGT